MLGQTSTIITLIFKKSFLINSESLKACNTLSNFMRGICDMIHIHWLDEESQLWEKNINSA